MSFLVCLYVWTKKATFGPSENSPLFTIGKKVMGGGGGVTQKCSVQTAFEWDTIEKSFWERNKKCFYWKQMLHVETEYKWNFLKGTIFVNGRVKENIGDICKCVCYLVTLFKMTAGQISVE